MDGLIVINKPLKCTSMDVIRVLRRVVGTRKVGHAGTLDPLATGVLLVCLGKVTKSINKLMGMEKEYFAEIDFSAKTETDDLESELLPVEIKTIPTLSEIKKNLESFIGDIKQAPPRYSAIKVGGQKAYSLAREGKRVNLGFRFVTINSIEVLSYNWPVLSIKIICESGVYIRSLARDLGDSLGVGGHLISLVRSRIGNYKIEDAVDLEAIKNDLKVVQDNILQVD